MMAGAYHLGIDMSRDQIDCVLKRLDDAHAPSNLTHELYLTSFVVCANIIDLVRAHSFRLRSVSRTRRPGAPQGRPRVT